MIAFDTETHLITPGCVDPKPVCVTIAREGQAPTIHTPEDGADIIFAALANGTPVVGHNVVYDLGVLCGRSEVAHSLVYDALDAGKVSCTKVAAHLINIREGRGHAKITLEALASRHAGMLLDKSEDSWRLRYSELDGVPFDQWPAAALDYALKDAEATLLVALSMPNLWEVETLFQLRAAWAINRLKINGVQADPVATEAKAVELTTKLETYTADLVDAGILKAVPLYSPKGPKAKVLGPLPIELKQDQKRTQDLVTAAYDGHPPTTDTGRVSIARDTLLQTAVPVLHALADRGRVQKTLDFIGTLRRVVEAGRFCPSWNVLVDSGRTSCGGEENPGNLQNQPRTGGIRECFVPAPGHWYLAADYVGAELCALGQITLDMFGQSNLADVLNRGEGPLEWFAAMLIGDTYASLMARVKAKDPEAKDARQFAKVAMYGFPGGLGPATLVDYARGYGLTITVDEAKRLQNRWFEAFPEMRHYFNVINDFCNQGWVQQHRSTRVRGTDSFCAIANSLFQGLTADGAKHALYEVSKACDLGTLAGYPVLFVHDEIILEVPADVDVANEAAATLQRIMIDCMSQHMPHVPIRTEAVLMDRWYKGASPKHDAQGRLVVWTPS